MNRKALDYRPPQLRPLFLCFVMLVVVVLIVLVELAIRFLPNEHDLSAISTNEPGLPSGLSSAPRSPQVAKQMAPPHPTSSRAFDFLTCPGTIFTMPRTFAYTHSPSPADFFSDPIACAGTAPERPTTTLEYTVIGDATFSPEPWTSTTADEGKPPSESPPEIDIDPVYLSMECSSRMAAAALRSATARFQSEAVFRKRNETAMASVQAGNVTCTITKVVSIVSGDVPPSLPDTSAWGRIRTTVAYTHKIDAAAADNTGFPLQTSVAAALPGLQPPGPPPWTPAGGGATPAPQVIFVTDSPAPTAQPGEALAATTVLRNSLGVSTGVGFVVRVTTSLLKNSLGVVTGKSVVFPSRILIPGSQASMAADITRQILTDPRGNPTAIVDAAPATSTAVLLITNSVGSITATTTEIIASQPTTTTPVFIQEIVAEPFLMTDSQYFIGFFLPTLLASFLAFLIRNISISAVMYEPFHLLTRRRSTARETLLFRPSPHFAAYESLRMRVVSLPLQAFLISGCATLLVPLSSEAVGLKLRGSCSEVDFTGCGMELAVSPVPARAIIGMLSLILFLVLATWVRLRYWKTGLVSNPWSIVGIATLTSHPCTRSLIETFPTSARIKHTEFIEHLQSYRFRLGYFGNGQDGLGYGIIVDREPVKEKSAEGTKESTSGTAPKRQSKPFRWTSFKQRISHRLGFLPIRSCWKQVAFLIFACGLLVLVLYYEESIYDTPLNRFMNTPGFGVRFLFTSFGVVVTLFWSSLFSTTATNSPFQALTNGPRPARRALTFTRPTDAFSGVIAASLQRDTRLTLVVLTTAAAEFMPILLANVRFHTTQTWHAHLAFVWLTTAILAWMVLVTAASCFWTASPVAPMPVDPTTLGGMMYYLADKGLVSEGAECKLATFGKGKEGRVGVWVEFEDEEKKDFKARVGHELQKAL